MEESENQKNLSQQLNLVIKRMGEIEKNLDEKKQKLAEVEIGFINHDLEVLEVKVNCPQALDDLNKMWHSLINNKNRITELPDDADVRMKRSAEKLTERKKDTEEMSEEELDEQERLKKMELKAARTKKMKHSAEKELEADRTKMWISAKKKNFLERIEDIQGQLNEKLREKYREELEELEKEVLNDKNVLKARWNKILEKLDDMVETAEDENLSENEEWQTLKANVRKVQKNANDKMAELEK
eukprot:Platyproteum_vivax@DN7524_c0_g2_i6.p1